MSLHSCLFGELCHLDLNTDVNASPIIKFNLIKRKDEKYPGVNVNTIDLPCFLLVCSHCSLTFHYTYCVFIWSSACLSVAFAEDTADVFIFFSSKEDQVV